MTGFTRQTRGFGAQCLPLGIALLLVACAQKPAARVTPPPTVVTSVASAGAVRPAERLAGIIAPAQNVAIQSTLTEPALAVEVQEGDRVRRGQVLARLDVSDLQATLDADLATAASARASTSHTVYQGGLAISQGVDQLSSAATAVSQAKANLERDARDLQRDTALFRNGYISEQQLQTQQTTVRNDQQAVRAALAAQASAKSNVTANGTLSSGGLQASSVEQARAQEQVALAQAQQVRVQIGKAVIVSPIDGVVVNRNINPGEYPGTRQIFTLQEVDPVYAVLRGSGAQVASIAAGSAAQVIISDLHNARATGTVAGVLNQIAPGSTDFQVKILLRNSDGRLRPGMAVESVVTLPPVRGVRVPATAFIDDNHNSVMVVSTEGVVQTVSVVELGHDQKTSVVSGLEPGARVINDGSTAVGNGQKVSLR